MWLSSAPLDIRLERMALNLDRRRRAADMRASRRRVGRTLPLPLMEAVAQEMKEKEGGGVRGVKVKVTLLGVYELSILKGYESNKRNNRMKCRSRP